MKILNKMSMIVASVAILTSVSSCKKILDEKPQSALYPDYFSTPGGVIGGITGVYQDLRQNYFGRQEFVWFYDGTDDSQFGSSGGGQLPLDTYSGINSSFTGPTFNPDGGVNSLWADINTLNGVIKFAPALSIDAATKAAYIAQAQFLRGWIYLFMVQTWGGTTATQKSGIPLHTTFITEATTADAPAAATDIYNQIIADFTAAAAALPNTITSSNPFSAGGQGKTATAAVANAYLAKTYLTRGYLTEVTPNAAADFQKAADLTAAIIANKGLYGLDLWQDYNDAHNQNNDYGKENMFAIDFGIGDPAFTGYTQQGNGGFGLNFITVLMRPNYIASPRVDNVAGKTDAVPQVFSGPAAMQRDVYNGRPYIRVAPNHVYTNKVFADQVHDARWDATFQTFWINNTNTAAGKKFDGTLKGKLAQTSNFSLSVYNVPVDGDTAVLMPGVEVTNARRDNFKGVIITPSQYSNDMFPCVKKFDDTRRTDRNDMSGRPLVFLRFSEIYMMNAEANYMLGGANISKAVASLNVIRQRAAYRVPADGDRIPKGQFRVTAGNMAALNAANAAEMALTPAQIALLSVPNNTTTLTPDICGMDLILDEYTREYYGDPRRWYDLVRTQQLVRRAKLYNARAKPNIQDYHMRRPIPQGLIDAVLTGPKYPQNNGY
ncbi:RagB/SusD family nutrient uptake outer membrane protein [Mucilaginibacter puniceus]